MYNSKSTLDNQDNKLLWFSNAVFTQKIKLKPGHPDIDEIIASVSAPGAISTSILRTHSGESQEGCCLTGQEAAVDFNILSKIMYLSSLNENSLHILENSSAFKIYVVIPRLIVKTRPEALLGMKHLYSEVLIDGESIRKENNRCIIISISMLAYVKYTPRPLSITT